MIFMRGSPVARLLALANGGILPCLSVVRLNCLILLGQTCRMSADADAAL